MAEKKWKPVHEVCIMQLSVVPISAEKLLHWAEVYSDVAIVPLEAIPRLMRIFQTAKVELNTRVELWEVDSAVELAIANLNVQLEEGEQEKKKS